MRKTLLELKVSYSVFKKMFEFPLDSRGQLIYELFTKDFQNNKKLVCN